MLYKKLTSKLVVALLCCIATPVWAAQNPITLEANYLQYNDETGDLSASGNVKLNQETTQIYTQQLTGNVKTGDMLANGQVTWTEAKSTLTGEKLDYNYKTKAGKMGTAKGNMDGVLITAESTLLQPKEAVTYHATVTKCPAQIPDYKMTAEKIIVYPGEKLIAYNVSFWIKNTKLFTLHKYVKKLDEQESDNLPIPSIGYRTAEGFFIKQHLEYPLNSKLSAMADINYYHKRGFEPQLGLINRSNHSTVTLIAGSEVNLDSEWYDRRPELVYSHNDFSMGKLPVKINYKFYAGRIIEDTTNTDLWRSGGAIYVSRNPLKLTDNTTLHLGGGYEYTWYEDHEERTIWRGNVGIKTALNERVNMGVGFNHEHSNGSTPFKYDAVDIKNELLTDLSWKIDRLWQVGVSTSYDLDNSRLADVDYTITRNLHCFETAVTYREKRDEWKFRVGVVNW